MDDLLSKLSGALFVVGFVLYIRAIVLQRTVPTRSTWIVWTVIDVIAVWTMRLEGALNWQITVAMCGAVIVMALSFIHGERGWSKLDLGCLVGAGAGIVAWLVLGDPLPALAASQLAGLVGGIPLVASAWEDPTREDRTGLACFGASSACMLFAVPEWTLANAMQPVQFAIVTGTVNAVLWLRPHRKTA